MTELIASIASVIIAIISTIIAGIAISQNSKLQRQNLAHQNYEDMKEWFKETVFIMKELYIKFPQKTESKEFKDTLVKMSANIDLGRIFFKNQIDGEYKINKPEIFRGRRTIVLDLLVLYYDIFKHGLQEENKDMVWSLQRAFISEMILFLDKNKSANDIVEYDYIDPEDIIDIKNINNEKFRQFLISDDIVKAIKEEGLKFSDLKQKTSKKKIKEKK